MSILIDGARHAQTAWEEGQMPQVRSLLPPLPDGGPFTKLPTVAPGCNPAGLTALLGPSVVSALVQQVAAPAIQSFMGDTLTGYQAQLQAYLAQLENEIERFQTDLPVHQTALDLAQAARAGLGQVRIALGQPAGEVIPPGVVAQVREACGAMGSFLDHVEAAITQAEAAITQAEQLVQDLQHRLAEALALKEHVHGLLTQTDAQITALPALLTNILGGAP